MYSFIEIKIKEFDVFLKTQRDNIIYNYSSTHLYSYDFEYIIH